MCGCCCCCFLLVGALGAAGGYIYNAYEEPSVDVTRVAFDEFEVIQNSLGLPSQVRIHLDVILRVTNPSRPPIEFTFKGFDGEVYSLDAQAENPELIGPTSLGEEVHIGAESENDIHIDASTTTETMMNMDLAQRLFSNCNPLTGALITKMRVHIKTATISLYGVEVNPTGIDHDFDVPCSLPR